MANSRIGNLKAVFSNVKIRTIMILTAGIMLLVIIVGVIGFRRTGQTSNATQLTKASSLQSVPGLQATSSQYAQTQQSVNQQNYQKANATQGTNIPTIINKQGLQSANNPDAYNINNGTGNTGTNDGTGENDGTSANGAGNGSANGAGGKNSSSQSDAQLKALSAQQKQQMDDMQKKLDELSSQQQQQQQQQTQADMQKEAQQLLAAWNGGNNNPVQKYVQGDLANNATGSTGTTDQTNASSSTSSTVPQIGGSMYGNSNTMIKAGTILFGVLETAVNSDEPGPVMVTIVDGQYKGSKLIGAIQSSPQIPGSNGATKLVLNFNTMSVPYLPDSIGVSAVAVDPDTARTALASDVDHHYLQRYGSLFASSFLEGWGNQISSAGDTVSVSPFGGTTTTRNGNGTTETVVVNPDGTTTTTTTNNGSSSGGTSFGIGQNVAAGLGQVGTNWGQQLGDTFNRKNTVMINAGVSVGLLFLNDVSSTTGNTPTTPAVTSQTSTTATTNTAATPSITPNTATTTTVTSSSTPAPIPVPTQ